MDILVNNATGWLADTFAARPPARPRRAQPGAGQREDLGAAVLGRRDGRRADDRRVRPPPHRRQGTWGRVIGLTSGGQLGFPEEISHIDVPDQRPSNRSSIWSSRMESS